MKAKIIIYLSALMLALSGCQKTPTEGYITGKRHEPAHSTYFTTRHGSTYIPHRVYHPEAWYLYVADSTDVRKVKVSQSNFNALSKGQYVKLSNPTDGGR